MLNLKPGVKIYLEFERHGAGYKLVIGRRVAKRAKVVSQKVVKSEEQLWIEIARWAADRLARLGLERTK